jgi:uncharacterized protein
MKQIRCAFDFDSVIADITPMCELISKKLGIPVCLEDIPQYNIEECFSLTNHETKEIIDEFLGFHFTQRLEPIPGAIEVLTEWYESGNDIIVITSREDEEFIYPWLLKHLSDIEICVYSSKSKGALCRELQITHFVDDCPSNLVDLANAGIVPIVFTQPYNRQLGSHRSLLKDLLIRVNSWEELRECLHNLKFSV